MRVKNEAIKGKQKQEREQHKLKEGISKKEINMQQEELSKILKEE